MVIKSGRAYTFYPILKVVYVSIFLWVGLHGFPYKTLRFCSFVVISVLWILYDITLFRKLVLNNDGYTVIFGRYKEFYAWDDLKTKSLKLYKYSSLSYVGGEVPAYKRCILLSPKANVNLKRIKPTTYMKLFHPLSCSCIHFNNDQINCTGDTHRIFEVNEEELKAKFEEWGVKVEGFTD